MDILADLHLHSRFARGCSKDLTLPKLEQWARVKGINLLGTGDFTHPSWRKEIGSTLHEHDGIMLSPKGFPFLLTTEISLIYSAGGKTRKVHNVVLAPSLQAVDGIIQYLLKHGRLDYDGRPIFKIPCPDFVEGLKAVDERVEVIPAHIWTPWFSLFGANSGFDSIKEAFQDMSKHIHAIETGMSSDPPMNWRIKDLANRSIVSFSDSHSFWPWRLGREATVFSVKERSYDHIIKAVHENHIVKTVETDPNYGKYHYTGHRNCHVVLSPEEAKKHNNICPVCKRPLTIGVLERVEALASFPEGHKPENAKPFVKLVPLNELIAGWLKAGVTTKKVWELHAALLKKFGAEFPVLLDASQDELAKVADPELASVILANREGRIAVKPGFDGLYGVPQIHGDEDYDWPSAVKHVPWEGTPQQAKGQRTLDGF